MASLGGEQSVRRRRRRLKKNYRTGKGAERKNKILNQLPGTDIFMTS